VATTARHSFIAVARNWRSVRREIRWRWMLKQLETTACVEMNRWADPGDLNPMQADLDAWLVHYNTERPHLGYRNMGRRPIETVMSFVRQEG
jgi:transposase InsO family protein